MVTVSWLLLAACWVAAHSARILVVIPFSGKSHYLAQRDIGLELARRGHQVHVITTHAEEEHPTTYHQVMVEKKWFRDFFVGNIFDMADSSFPAFQFTLYQTGLWHTEVVLTSPEVKKFLDEDHKFDLVINEVFFQDALYTLALKYNAPQVLLTTYGNSFKINYLTRNPPQLSTAIHEYGNINNPGTFLARLKNLYFCVYDAVMMKFYYLPRQYGLAKKYIKGLPEPLPSLEEVTANASLVLMNSHFSTSTPGPYLPNTVEVGGLYLKETTKKLPEDLQKFLDSSPEGVVYMSLGTNVHSTELPSDKLDAFIKVFGRLKQKVLWKWEETALPGKPGNVEIRTWMPQKEILAHPNVRLFITHGGLLSVHEATFNGKPFIGIPIFGDQHKNIRNAVSHGYAAELPYDDINEENLDSILNKMLEDNESYDNAQKASRRFKDRPMSALDTAVFWIEYVIRNNGADYMKSPGRNMNVFAFYMVDIEIFILAVVVLVAYLLNKLFKLCKRSNAKKPIKKIKHN